MIHQNNSIVIENTSEEQISQMITLSIQIHFKLHVPFYHHMMIMLIITVNKMIIFVKWLINDNI